MTLLHSRRFACRRRTSVLLPPLLALALALLPAIAPAAPAPRTDLAQLPSLWEHRAGISEREPDFCPTELTRETNESAANRSSIEAGPSTFLVEGLSPGTTYRHCFYVFNRHADPRTFEFEGVDVTGSLDPDVRLETLDQPVLLGSWIRLPETRLELGPGERAVVPYELAVPPQPPAGTVTGGIRITDVTGEDTETTTVRKSLVLQVQTTFEGGIERKVKVSDVKAPRLLLRGIDADRYRVRYVVANEGTVVDVITQRLRVEGLFGRKVADVRRAPDVLAPRSAQHGELEWEGLPWIGRYEPRIEVATQDGASTVTLPTLWIVPPWPYIAAVALLVLALVVGIVRRRRAGWRAYLDEEYARLEDWEDGEEHV